MQRYPDRLQQVSIAEITPGTDLSELFKIVQKYNHLPISLGIETGMDYFYNSDEHRVLKELCKNRKAVGFKSELHLNGTNNHWYCNSACQNAWRLPNRVIFNLNTIPVDEYHRIIGRSGYLFAKKECYLLNAEATNAELGRCVEEFNLVNRGVKFLQYPGNFENGEFRVTMPLFGRSNEYDWCGKICPKTVSAALDWIVRRYGFGSARVMTRGGAMTDSKTDLIKVGDYLENISQWNDNIKIRLAQNQKVSL